MNTAPTLQDKQREFSTEELKNPVSSVPRLDYQDISRLSGYLQPDPSIFGTSDCNIWQGYYKKNASAQISVNNKKHPISRLLYHNFVGPVTDNLQIVYTCYNKGKCATITHLKSEKKKSKLVAGEPIVLPNLSRKKILRIYNSNLSRNEIAVQENVSLSTVRKIKLKLSHTDITNPDNNKNEGSLPNIKVSKKKIVIDFD